MLTRRQTISAGGAALALGPLPARAMSGPRPRDFLIGADISWIPEDEARGATYYLDGVRRDPLEIFREAGFNALKLRLFVDPSQGYSKNKPGGPWCGLEQTIAFSKRIKAAGFHLSTTLHYSDTWADPQHQDKPAAWADLPFARLVDTVHRYTSETWAAIKAADAAPDIAILGNETTFGMLWPEGRVPLTIPTGNPQTDDVHMKVVGAGGYDRFAALLKAGVAATRETLPGVPIALHNHLGRHWPIVRHWTDSLVERGVDFDALGLSCYQQQAEGDWERTFAEFGKRYPGKGFFAIEYSSRKRYLNDLVRARPTGWGSYIWEPTRHQEAIFLQNGENAGEGPRPNLLAQGINSAEAPGAAPAATPAPRRKREQGGRYDADPTFIRLYQQMAKDYGVLK
ncbi:glycosyl hydrolase 53 family protein [Sphingomonas sp. M1-B02]|uniref:glycosyl hydrolase 53 family protein n=1 Tax=Sphingomonas sp. M1-B02 TaxID=3114300 RepID=UPI002240C0D6|nr:glycosyl hydrolase 53 family protein [Sphingomonas sp. S6-11]UZK64686.1 arabinogalactan endo-1,4-beta-galactosidase [Sphingomonas sp. S6-11]